MPTDVPTGKEFADLAARVAKLEAQQASTPVETPDSQLTPPTPDTAAERKLVWSDEFTGTAVDPTKWNVRNNAYASNEESIVTSRLANVFVKDGKLTLRALKETYATAGGTTRNFTSAYLDTRGKGAWQYGRFEMRAKLPTAKGKTKGFWPAFWLRPDAGGDGEIDIMEAIGNEENIVHATVHHDYRTDATHIKMQPTAFTAPVSLANDFHVYAFEWTADSMVWFLDGKEYFRRDTTTTPWFAEVFRKPYQIRLNLQVGGSWAKTPDDTTVFPGDYVIDWIRVYAPK